MTLAFTERNLFRVIVLPFLIYNIRLFYFCIYFFQVHIKFNILPQALVKYPVHYNN